jgi:hypothetical protein
MDLLRENMGNGCADHAHAAAKYQDRIQHDVRKVTSH